VLIPGKNRNKIFVSAQCAEALILGNAGYVEAIEPAEASISWSISWRGGEC